MTTRRQSGDGATTRRVALVTGGSRGIGAATAVGLAGNGWDVAISYREQAAAGDEVVSACRQLGRRAVAIRADMAVPADIDALFEELDGHLGQLSALVNNAGIVVGQSALVDVSSERVTQLMAVNVVAPLLCASRAVARMSTARGGGGGVIVNVSSVAARLGSPGEYVDYAASKGAIDTMTVGLAVEVAGEGIRVNAVRPGVIDTEIHASGGEPGRAARVGMDVPMRRPGRATEVAAAIVWLCSDASSYVTGALLDVGGGR
jgi:NAD(P)-dependent dehydrogenase (short-subunit alcohol dehydrogenase family)